MFKKNTALTGLFIGSFVKTADGTLATSGTPTAAMVQDGTPAACGNIPAYDATAKGWIVTLSAGTMNANKVGLHFELTNYQPIDILLTTETKQMADLQDLAAGAAMNLATSAVGSAAITAGAVTKMQLGLAVDSTVAKEATLTAGTVTLAAAYDDAKTAAQVGDAMTLAAGANASGTFTVGAVTKLQLGLAVPGSQMDLVNAPNSTALSAIKTALTLPTGIPKNVALPNFTFPMWDASNPEVVKSGLTVTGTIRKDGGAFAAIAGAISEIAATGMYTVNLAQAEMNADLIELKFVAVGGSDQPVLIKTNA